MTIPTQRGAGEPMPQRIEQVLAEIQDLKLQIVPFAQRIADHDDDIKDHETRIRVLFERVPSDLQTQLATLHARKSVAPAVVWAAVGLAFTALGVLAAFLSVH